MLGGEVDDALTVWRVTSWAHGLRRSIHLEWLTAL